MSGVSNWFGSRNTILPVMDSAGFKLCVANTAAALPLIMAAKDETEWNENYLMSELGARSYFGEVCLLSLGAAGLNSIQTIFWLVAGIISLPFGTEPAKEALRSMVKTVANLFFALVGLIGMISPRHACSFGVGVLYRFFVYAFNRSDRDVVAGFVVSKIVGFIQGGVWLSGLAPREENAPQNAWVARIQALSDLQSFRTMKATPTIENLKAFAIEAFVRPVIEREIADRMRQMAANLPPQAAAIGSALSGAAAFAAPLAGNVFGNLPPEFQQLFGGFFGAAQR